MTTRVILIGEQTMRVEGSKEHARFHPLIYIAVLAASATASSQLHAQEQPRPQEELRIAAAPGATQQPQQLIWNQVRVIHVKSDRVSQFEELIKELGTAIAKQGRGMNVWQVALGDQNTFHIVSQLESFATLAQMQANPPMEPTQWTNWLNRIEPTIDSQAVSVYQVHPDLSII